MQQAKDPSQDASHVPWKALALTTAECFITFYLATFCLAMYFTHGGLNHVFTLIFFLLLYLFIIVVCAKRIMNQLSVASVMLIIPIAPLLGLITVISLIPILEKL